MKNILIVGAGRIGSVVTDLLASTPEEDGYCVTVADRSAELLASIDPQARLTRRLDTLLLDVDDPAPLGKALRGRFAVLNAAPFHLTTQVAHAAKAAQAHYLDLTEDVASTRQIRALALDARTAFVPQCGLAPGFVSIVAADLARRFESLDSVRLRVGALPVYPSNTLNYNLTWSTEGVINEYCEPCEAIVDGQVREVQALEEREEFSLDGVRYEAFNTSGGLGTLCETLTGKVRTLNYRTIRYPGHAAIMKTLLHDLRLKDRRHILKDILEHALPTTLQDVVIVFVTVAGLRNGRLEQDTFAHRIYSRMLAGKMRSAIQITTASSLCTMLDMLASGQLPQHGLVRQESVALPAFLANRFGQAFASQAFAHAA